MIAFLDWLNGVLWGVPLIAMMIVAGLYFTVRSGFFQFRHFGWIVSHTAGRLTKKDENVSDKNTISPFEAICTAIGGTVGFGNIAGVATAVASGGPGAVLWMWLTASLGLILKQVEVTLGCYYRSTTASGSKVGGPTYYMQKGLGEEKHWGKFWKIPAVIFGIGIFSTFFITSSNLTASEVVAGAFRLGDITIGNFVIEGEIIIGIVLCIITYIITSGGVKGVASVFSKLVPFMSIAYIIMGLMIVIANIENVPSAVAMIFHDAFTGTAAIGGFAGAAVSQILQTGMARSVYSNEAGWGTSPMIHASSHTRHPVEQGLWGTFEVFFDTFVVCSITAFSVIFSGMWTSGETGGELALSAFDQSFGFVGSVMLAIIMVIFTVTTSGGWFTYYMAILEHMNMKENKFTKILMKIFYAVRALPGLLWTIYLVKISNTGFIWTVVDITSAIPTFVNVFVILVLSGKYFQLLKDYKARYMGIGKVDENMVLFYEDKEKTK